MWTLTWQDIARPLLSRQQSKSNVILEIHILLKDEGTHLSEFLTSFVIAKNLPKQSSDNSELSPGDELNAIDREDPGGRR